MTDPIGNDIFTLHRGQAPLLLSLPHVGTHLPDDVRRQLVDRAARTEDTDWHLERLYDFAAELGDGAVVPTLELALQHAQAQAQARPPAAA